jgi:hypothetical protein
MIRPQLIALDTAQLADWSREHASLDRARAGGATRLAEDFFEKGFLILIAFHHLEELFATQSEATASAAYHFIRSLPMVAWIENAHRDPLPGGFLDIAAAELKVALRSPDGDVNSICERVRPELVKVGTGMRLLPADFSEWNILRAEFLARQKHQRNIVSILRTKVIPRSEIKVADLPNKKMRSFESAMATFKERVPELAHDIAMRGDARIGDPNEVARWFFDRVANVLPHPPATLEELLDNILALADVDRRELQPGMTLDDVATLVSRNGKLRIIADLAGESWQVVKTNLEADRLPSWQIVEAIETHRPDLNRHKGSEMNDGYLAALAPYAAITFVDKQTCEAFRRAVIACPALKAVGSSIRKSVPYGRLLEEICSRQP